MPVDKLAFLPHFFLHGTFRANVLSADLGLSQIFPIIDEDTDAELKVIHSTFCDPYLLLIRDDYSIQILETDKNGELDEVERTDALLSSRWLSGCVYKSEVTGGKALLFLLTAEGGLVVRFHARYKRSLTAG